MRYHDITTDDMLNGDGLRTVLWVAGCNHHCPNCQNPITWDSTGGVLFDEKAEIELFEKLNKTYISGITFSGGDPLNENNVSEIKRLIKKIRYEYPEKNIWLYSGFTYEQITKSLNEKNMPENKEIAELRIEIINNCDIFVDGRFVEEEKDINIPYVGSKNQRILSMCKK